MREERGAYTQLGAIMSIAEGCACLECWKAKEKRKAYDQWLKRSEKS